MGSDAHQLPAPRPGPSQAASSIGTRSSVAVAALVGAAVVWWFHTRSWYGPDEGAYSYVAGRLLDGARLNGPAPTDVQDIHLGYVNHLNAAVRAVLGDQLVRLRLPLVALGGIIAAAGAWLLRHRGPILATTAGVTAAAISIPLFYNPSAHWYVLALAAVLAVLLSSEAVQRPLRAGRAPSTRTMLAVGALLGLAIGLRQLSGVHVCLATVGVLWASSGSEERSQNRPNPLNVVAGIGAAAVIVGYLLTRTNAVSWPLYAVGPMAVLVLTSARSTLNPRQTLRIGAGLAAGTLAALAPLVVGHAARGSLGSWFGDTVGAAGGLTSNGWVSAQSTVNLVSLSIQRLVTATAPGQLLGGAFWLCMCLLGPVLGARVAWSLVRRPDRALPPVTVVAVFTTLITAHYQVPVYVAFSAGLALIGHLALGDDPAPRSEARPLATRAAAWLLPSILLAGSLLGQAGEGPTRTLSETLSGERQALTADPALGTGLRLPPDEAEDYRAVLDAIDRHVDPGGSFLALPSNPELYDLSARRSPFRWWNASFGLSSAADRRAAIAEVRRHPPPLVVLRPDDKYLTDDVRPLVDEITDDYRRIDTIGEWELWVPNP